MKNLKTLFVFAAILMFCGISMVGCKNKPAEVATESKTVDEVDTFFTAINRYLVDSIASHYAEGELSIPNVMFVAVDESNADDILVWGDFWVFNYNLSGDTLKTVSGGDHPGLMHVRQTENGFVVTGFDQVADGAENTKSAMRIFGEKYDAFHAVNSDEKKREAHRLATVAEYVVKNGVAATMLHDFGWPAIQLPLEQK